VYEKVVTAPIFDAGAKQALYADYKKFACGG
jgi:hypothetical protein